MHTFNGGLIQRIAAAVSRIDNLEFLADVIPKTQTYKQFKENWANEEVAASGAVAAAAAAASNSSPQLVKGQTTLNGALQIHRKEDSGQSGKASTARTKGPASLSALMADGSPLTKPTEEDEDVDMTEEDDA